MKKLFYYFALFLFVGLVSCSNDDPPYIPVLPEVSISNVSGVVAVAQEDTIYLKAEMRSELKSEFSWAVNGTKTTTVDSVFKFTEKEVGDYKVTLTCSNADGETTSDINLSVYGKFRDGTFVLSEGNMTTQNGSLVFISPKGVVTDSAYWRVNGTEIGNATQDMFIANGRMYIISQNPGRTDNYPSDGKLIVANAQTLKKETAYNDEINGLSWPTHLAVLGNEIFIRDNNGVHSFNTSTKEMKFIEGSKGALKNRMVVVNNKVFVPANKSILVIEEGMDKVSETIDVKLTVSGVVKTSDGNIYVSTTGTPNKIMKINATDHSIIKINEISTGSLSAGWGATPGISAKGDTIYYGSPSLRIYRHIFSTGVSEELVKVSDYVSNATMAYNNLGVNPVTGEVYLTTIKNYGWDYLINNISVFNFSKAEPKLSANYTDYTRFPAGIYFTYDFE